MTSCIEEPDPRREALSFLEWNPGKRLLRAIRTYQRHRSRRSPWSAFMCRAAVLRHRFWGAVSGADIPLNTVIGVGLLIPHPNGVVIHPKARIGANCLLFQQVTLGLSSTDSGAPVLGDHVDVGAGAKILGGITIGDGARVGANAVVLEDVLNHAVVVGIPARQLGPKLKDPIHTERSTHVTSGDQGDGERACLAHPSDLPLVPRTGRELVLSPVAPYDDACAWEGVMHVLLCSRADAS